MEPLHPSLAEFPVVVTLSVLWGDQDSFRHVNNTVYLRWAETARVDYLTRVGLWRMIEEVSVGPILAALSCNYRRVVTYPDTVHVGARVKRIGNSSFGMDHVIVSEAQGEVVAEVDSTMVVLDYSQNKSIPVPEHVRKAIEEMESRAFSAPGRQS